MKHIFLLLILLFCCSVTGIACAEVPQYGNWTEITNNVNFGERHFFGSASFDNRLWVVGGVDNRSGLKNDVWSSLDGKQWDLITDSASFSQRASFGVMEFNNRLWIIGGSAKEKLLNDVWSSPDGKKWEFITSNASFSPRCNMGIAVFDNRLWVIGGESGWGTYTNDVWSSPDGKKWEVITSNASFSPRYSHGVATLDNRLWVIGGYDGEGHNDIWSSRDGKNWILVNANAPFKKMDFISLIVFDNKLWIVGGGSYPPSHSTKRVVERAYDEVWSSPDGNNWTLETEHAGFGPRYLHAVTVFKNGIWVIGGEESNNKDVWYMPALHPERTPLPDYPVLLNTAPDKEQTTNSSPTPSWLVIIAVSCSAVFFLKKRMDE